MQDLFGTINKNELKGGKRSLNNPLNDLNGKEWVFNTNSIESFETPENEREFNKYLIELIETRYPTNGEESFAHKIRKVHPSPKPPQLMERLIRFFSKENELVFDPFCGVGGALIGATISNRKAIGIDLNSAYLKIYENACEYLKIEKQKVYCIDSKKMDSLTEIRNVMFDLIITDPPYGNMMTKVKTGEAAKKKKDISPTPFTNFTNDIGNLELNEFLNELKVIMEISFNKLKNKRYILVFLKDFQPKPEYHGMLHFDVMKKLIEIPGLYYKGFKIWYDKTINLYPYGYPYAYVGNQLHQYILIFRKEINMPRKK